MFRSWRYFRSIIRLAHGIAVSSSERDLYWSPRFTSNGTTTAMRPTQSARDRRNDFSELRVTIGAIEN